MGGSKPLPAVEWVRVPADPSCGILSWGVRWRSHGLLGEACSWAGVSNLLFSGLGLVRWVAGLCRLQAKIYKLNAPFMHPRVARGRSICAVSAGHSTFNALERHEGDDVNPGRQAQVLEGPGLGLPGAVGF